LLLGEKPKGGVMKISKVVRIYLLVAAASIGGLPAHAASVPYRKSSDNGQGTQGAQAVAWSLLGRTAPVTLKANGKAITMSRQVVCISNTEGADLASAPGACSEGTYIFLYQIHSGSPGVTVELSGLEEGSFTKHDADDSATYGVLICDDSTGTGNVLELCTEDSEGPPYPNLDKITFEVKSTTSVSFTIASFPSFPAGVNPAEGQGWTLFIETQQTSPLPISFPIVSVH
jgi:hypothetical protein